MRISACIKKMRALRRVWTKKQSKTPTSFFPAVPDEFLGDPPPARLRAQQLQLGHDGQVVADCRPQLVEQEAQALDDRGAHLLVGAALLLVSLTFGSRYECKFIVKRQLTRALSRYC